MRQEGAGRKKGKTDQWGRSDSEQLDVHEHIAGGETQKNKQGIISGILREVDLGDSQRHYCRGQECEARRPKKTGDIKQHGDGRYGKQRGQGTNCKRAGSKAIDPPTKNDEIKRRMWIAVKMRPDLRPGRGGGKISKSQRIGLNDANRRVIVKRTVAHGHFDGP